MKGLSFVEIVLALAILSVICGISFFIFHQSSISSYEIEGSSTLIQQLSQGVDMIKWDMLNTQYSEVKIYGDDEDFTDLNNFPDSGSLHAWVFPTAYHKDSNKFKVDGDFNPDWQGGIVYCPYRKDTNSPPELRKYCFYYEGAGDFTLPFEITYIDNYIELQDFSVPTPKDIRINRQFGTIPTPESNNWSPGNPLYRVAVSKISKTNISPDPESSPPPLKIILLVRVKGRFENKLFEETTLYVSPRN